MQYYLLCWKGVSHSGVTDTYWQLTCAHSHRAEVAAPLLAPEKLLCWCWLLQGRGSGWGLGHAAPRELGDVKARAAFAVLSSCVTLLPSSARCCMLGLS